MASDRPDLDVFYDWDVPPSAEGTVASGSWAEGASPSTGDWVWAGDQKDGCMRFQYCLVESFDGSVVVLRPAGRIHTVPV